MISIKDDMLLYAITDRSWLKGRTDGPRDPPPAGGRRAERRRNVYTAA